MKMMLQSLVKQESNKAGTSENSVQVKMGRKLEDIRQYLWNASLVVLRVEKSIIINLSHQSG